MADARGAIITSAMVVSGIYAYRRLVETTSSSQSAGNVPAKKGHALEATAQLVTGQGAPPSMGRFVTGWGVVYLTLAALEGPAPELVESFAWLVAVGALLGNGAQIAQDISSGLNSEAKYAGNNGGPPATATVMITSAGTSSAPALGVRS